jgi:hypothetical protein
VSAPPSRSKRRYKLLRVLGILALTWSLALLVLPMSYTWKNFFASGRTNCGVPLQALFRPPGEGCEIEASRQVAKSIAVAGVGVALLAFSGIRRRLRFLGFVLLAASPFVMMVPTDEGFIEIDRPGLCGSGIGDLVRRGYTEVTFDGGTGPLDPACGDMALNRLYMTLGVAGAGAALLVIDSIRQRRTASRSP